MPSKISTFDFLRQFSTPKKGVHIYVINDPFVETFLKNRLKENAKFDLITGSELTRNFLEERFTNLSLFALDANVLVLNGEAITEKKSLKEKAKDKNCSALFEALREWGIKK